MMAITHAALSVAGTSLLLGTSSPIALGLAVLGSQLPDIDTSTSTIGQVCFPLSTWIEKRYPHRSITHSLLATLSIAAIALPIGHYYQSLSIALALPLGHVIACFSDCFTKQGVQLFWPDPAWAISVANPRRRIETGSKAEYWVLATATALLLLGIWFANGGGPVQKVSQQLGLNSGLIQLYNEQSSTHQIWAEINGVFTSDRSPAAGKFLIVDTTDKTFILSDGEAVYETGKQIITTKINAIVGNPAQTRIETLAYNDTDAVAPLLSLQQRYPNAAIYLSGELVIDFPDDVKVEFDPNQMQTIKLSGNRVKLAYYPLEKALISLQDQYAIGTVIAKIINPGP